MESEKNHFKFWQIRKIVALIAVIVSAFCANSFNTTIIFVWLAGVVVPIVVLFLTSNDGDETTFAIEWVKEKLGLNYNIKL